MLSLKLFHILPDPSSVRDHDVPVRVRELGTSITSEWDLTLQQILPYNVYFIFLIIHWICHHDGNVYYPTY